MREIIRASAWSGFQRPGDGAGRRSRSDPCGGAGRHGRAAGSGALPAPARLPRQPAIAAEQLGRTRFRPVLGQQQTMSVLGALSIAIINSQTAREGIEIAARYMHVHNPAFTMTLAPMPKTTATSCRCAVELRGTMAARAERRADHRLDPQVARSTWRRASTSRMKCGSCTSRSRRSPPIATRSASRRFRQADDGHRHRAHHSRFLAARRIPRRCGTSPRSICRTQSPPRNKDFTTRVASMARSLLNGGECTPEQAAKALGIHARTLQRRLKDEGSSFEKIKDDARREWAESLLVQPAVTLSQIAQMLDYADSSAFSRSCRRWFGEAPRTYRAGWWRRGRRRRQRPEARGSIRWRRAMRANSQTAPQRKPSSAGRFDRDIPQAGSRRRHRPHADRRRTSRDAPGWVSCAMSQSSQ